MILTLSFGAGHVRAAEAVRAEFARQRPNAELKLVDALENCRFLFRFFYVWTYWAMIRFAPSLWGRFFASRVKRNDKQTAPVWAWKWGCTQVFAEIESFQPDIIICCEVGASELAVIAKRVYLTQAEIINVITDFEAEPIWVTPEVSLFIVPDKSVSRQLQEWGACAEAIRVCGIPIDQSFITKYDSEKTRQKFGLDDRQVVLMMGGGMGPTRMDQVAARLLESDQRLQIVALPGRDKKMGHNLTKLRNSDSATLKVVNWTDEVAGLMQTADVLITKSGGLTLAEAAASGVPLVLFDSIPGPENANATYFTTAGAAVMTSNSIETAEVCLDILRNAEKRFEMAKIAVNLALPKAAKDIVEAAVACLEIRSASPKKIHDRVSHEFEKHERPVLILTISNGYGHIRVAEGLAASIRKTRPSTPVLVVDIADHMSALIRFTHITAYLWILKNIPAIWDVIDRYQKKQTQTSPDWFYRNGCRSLFNLALRIQPVALVATEVGCCEIAALIKRDMDLDIPLIAVSNEMDADRAWVQPEVDLYSFVTEDSSEILVRNGAIREKIAIWGATLSVGFDTPRDHKLERIDMCHWLNLDPDKPLILIAGGGEGMGQIEKTVAKLLDLSDPRPQLVVLTGRNERLKARCERLATGFQRDRVRVLGWIGPTEMPRLMSAADMIVSKLGSTFHEAIASELPIIALEPPPGSERIQYRLLDDWQIGRAVRTLDEMAVAVADLLNNREKLDALRENARKRKKTDAADRVGRWLDRTLSRDIAATEKARHDINIVDQVVSGA